MAFNSSELRRRFLKFFQTHQHLQLFSSPVVALGDPTLLFTNAGMNQFKDLFLGKVAPPNQSLVTCQACVRVGGKHNDLENVGHTKRHLTLFEMLGNFSFGGYFKRQAIDFSWEVATQIFEFDPQKIYPTVYCEDDEAYRLWSAHVPKERITKLGKTENFWSMGSSGPCGPCSELLFDRGPSFGPATNPAEDTTGERFLEFWNLVFMQNNQLSDGSLQPLIQPMIDTGAGLERIAMLKMGVDSVFETDILRALICSVEAISNRAYGRDAVADSSMRVIADHCRTIAFCIADGAPPSNVEHGYVVRKLIRRAMRYGKLLGLNEPFLDKILPKVGHLMGGDYPRLSPAMEEICRIACAEELSFLKTLERGERHFNEAKDRAKMQKRALSAQEIFVLKDTYGLPFDEISYLAEDADLNLDAKGFFQLDQAAKELSKKSAVRSKGDAQDLSVTLWQRLEKEGLKSAFCGYECYECETEIAVIIANNKVKDRLQTGESAQIALTKTPFYAESGGQVSDHGQLIVENSLFEVKDCQFIGNLIIHKGVLKQGELTAKTSVCAKIDQKRRKANQINHSATHLLDWALGQILLSRIEQAGSLVLPDRLRFDIKWPKPLTETQIEAVEDLVNQQIGTNHLTNVKEISLDDAKSDPEIQQQFGDKYGSVVRLVKIGPSKSLCCGTHVENSSQIESFRIVKESSIGAGLRRIEALTGTLARRWAKERESLLSKIIHSLQTVPEKALEEIERLKNSRAQLQSKCDELAKENCQTLANDLWEKALLVKNDAIDQPFRLIIKSVDCDDLKLLADQLVTRPACACLTKPIGDRARIMLRLSPHLARAGLRAQDLWTHFEKAGFRGKGGLDLAQGVGLQVDLEKALNALKKALTS